MASEDEPPIDSLLIVSFGGPEHPDHVLPFLRNVTRGRGVPDERLATVAAQYERFDGVSPLNEQCRELRSRLSDALGRHGRPLPVYWGNRNWHPLLDDVLAEMAAAGRRHALAFVTSAYSSYSSCRQYLDNIETARAKTGDQAPRVSKLRQFFNHPEFVQLMAANTRAALAGFDPALPVGVLFTAHSIPVSQAAACDYEEQLRETARLVAEAAAVRSEWELVWQSRSGPPQVPWLEPDITTRVAQLAAAGVHQIAAVPIGFLSDHMEVVYDLDVLAADAARQAGVNFARAATVGNHPAFVDMIVELVGEHFGAPARAIGSLGVRPSPCAPGCCPRPSPDRVAAPRPPA